ncbi:MAG: HD domain-containing protein [Anaerolineales bacterium]
MSYSPLVDAALIFAARAHRHQVRKGTDTPYIVHPVGVMLLLEHAGETDPELLAAALLHDTLEDAGVTLDELAQRFGPRVAEIVLGCTEPDHGSASWEVRKQHTVASLRDAPRDVQLVAAADKLHNLTSMTLEHVHQGDQLWQRFNRGRASIEWYYRAIAASLSATAAGDHPLIQELQATVTNFFGPATAASSDNPPAPTPSGS